MGGRAKLNAANLNGALLVAGVIGYWSRSWTLFFVVLAVLIALAVQSGGIRNSP